MCEGQGVYVCKCEDACECVRETISCVRVCVSYKCEGVRVCVSGHMSV